MVTELISCPHCASDDIVKNGFSPNGKQKYLPRLQESKPRSPFSQRYTLERKEEILRAYQERSSLRGLIRTFGVSPTTAIGWLKKVAGLKLDDTLLFAETKEAPRTLKLDELWSFVYGKSDKVWVWLALCQETRQVVAFVTGERSRRACKRLWQALSESYKNVTCYSDF